MDNSKYPHALAMKPGKNIFALCIGLLLCFSGCIIEFDDDSDTVRGEGPLVTENRTISAPNEVVFAIDGALFIEQGGSDGITR